MSKLTQLTTQLTELKKRFRTEGKAALHEAFQEFLDLYPEVEALRWKQYTPYFNDGEACTFRIGDLNLKLVGVDTGGDYDDGFDGPQTEPLLSSYCVLARDMYNPELLLAVFDDHVQVTVTREGLEIEEYEHG